MRAGPVTVQSLASEVPAHEEARCAAAGVLLECIQRMGRQASNAVLQVLANTERLVEGRKYPPSPLVFGNGRWRAYYHSHSLNAGWADEHGHFHLFVRTSEDSECDEWTHVAGLAMDMQGQPLRWFATNRWVTAGHWGARDDILEEIDLLTDAVQGALAGQWLTAMLRLYRAEIGDLLTARDGTIIKEGAGKGMQQVLGDRTLYQLAEVRIDLVHTLQRRLSG